MERTRENTIKLLKQMMKNAYSTADYFKDTDPSFSVRMRREGICRQQCIWLLTNQEFFDNMWNTYFRKEGEN